VIRFNWQECLHDLRMGTAAVDLPGRFLGVMEGEVHGSAEPGLPLQKLLDLPIVVGAGQRRGKLKPTLEWRRVEEAAYDRDIDTESVEQLISHEAQIETRAGGRPEDKRPS
jgi:hypothetical protein